MKKLCSIIIAFVLTSLIANSQTFEPAFNTIKSKEQALNFIAKNSTKKLSIVTLNEESDTTEIVLPIYKEKKGFAFSIGKRKDKILQTDSLLAFRVSYIYLDGNILKPSSIDSLKRIIIDACSNGDAFYDLVKWFNMEPFESNGDTKWFYENMMVPNFEAEVRKRKREKFLLLKRQKISGITLF